MPDTVINSAPERVAKAETEAHLDAQAEADYKAGRIVPHERVMYWLDRLAKGERVPRPTA